MRKGGGSQVRLPKDSLDFYFGIIFQVGSISPLHKVLESEDCFPVSLTLLQSSQVPLRLDGRRRASGPG